jgi:predicted DNA-binding transcriptional regulator AlpA
MQTQKQTEAERAKRRADRRAKRLRVAAERAAAVLNADGLLRLPEVLAVVPVASSTWWAGVRSGRFPAGVKLGARCTAWRAADIRELLAKIGEGAQS